MIIPNIWEHKKMFQTTNQLENDSRTALANLHFEPAQPILKMVQQMWGTMYSRNDHYFGSPQQIVAL